LVVLRRRDIEGEGVKIALARTLLRGLLNEVRPFWPTVGRVSRRRQVSIEAAWFNQFAAADRPAAVCEARDSHVFEVWFLEYFTRRQHGLEG
jgi:hypothetical protein